MPEEDWIVGVLRRQEVAKVFDDHVSVVVRLMIQAHCSFIKYARPNYRENNISDGQ